MYLYGDFRFSYTIVVEWCYQIRKGAKSPVNSAHLRYRSARYYPNSIHVTPTNEVLFARVH